MPYRDENIICIELGSHTTRSIIGLAESLTPPTLRTRTLVSHCERSGVYFCGTDIDCYPMQESSDITIIEPIVEGRVNNWEALSAFLDHLLYTMTHQIPGTLESKFPVVLIIPSTWSRQDSERITQIFLEDFLCPAFMTIDSAVASLYACNSISGLVVDVGHHKTSITPILDSIVVYPASTSIPVGGHHMTAHLKELFLKDPPLYHGSQVSVPVDSITYEMAEATKVSEICEVLPFGNVMNRSEMAFQSDIHSDANAEEGVLDIAAVVASGKTREYLARVEAEKMGLANGPKNLVPNSTLTHNTVSVGVNQALMVNRSRFQVCDPLLNSTLFDGIFAAINHTSVEPARRKELWENIVLTGCGSSIRGFREHFVATLIAKYVLRGTQPVTEQYNIHPQMSLHPSSIRLARIPIHFPEWNKKDEDDTGKGSIEEAHFLGAQIMAHIAFSSTETGAARLYITSADYAEHGPTGIHL